MFDTFMMRTRMESVLTAALQPAGIRSGDYAVVSLIAVEGSMTPATFARLLGVAPLVAGRTGGPALAVGVDPAWQFKVPPPEARPSSLAPTSPPASQAGSRDNEAGRATDIAVGV